jgi:beta-lactamase class D
VLVHFLRSHERENKVYPFALNIDMNADKDAAKRIPIALECLQALGKLCRNLLVWLS